MICWAKRTGSRRERCLKPVDGPWEAHLPKESDQGIKHGPRANAGREGTSVLTVVTPGEPTPAATMTGGSLIDEIVRDGARRMLAAALEAEVAAYIAAHTGELDVDGRRLVVRNGHSPGRGEAVRARHDRCPG